MKHDSPENQRRILLINLILNSKPRMEKQGRVTEVIDRNTSWRISGNTMHWSEKYYRKLKTKVGVVSE